MTETPLDDAFLETLASGVGAILGKAGHATFRYAAFEEGKRLGGPYRDRPLTALISHLDAVLGQASVLESEADDAITIQVERSRFLERKEDLLDSIVLGSFEGALYARGAKRWDGRVERANGTARIVLAPRGGEE